MKPTLRIFLALAALFAVAPFTCSAPPTTGQFLFQRKTNTGPFDQFGVTPVAGQVFGWDGTNVSTYGLGGISGILPVASGGTGLSALGAGVTAAFTAGATTGGNGATDDGKMAIFQGTGALNATEFVNVRATAFSGAQMRLWGATNNFYGLITPEALTGGARIWRMPDVTGRVITDGNLTDITGAAGGAFGDAAYRTTSSGGNGSADAGKVARFGSDGGVSFSGEVQIRSETGDDPGAILFYNAAGTHSISLVAPTLTAARQVNWPNASGVIITTGNLTDITSTGTVTSGTWSGSFGAVSGANLTTLNANNISSGTIADARLSANVPLLNAANLYSAIQRLQTSSVGETELQVLSFPNGTGNGVSIGFHLNSPDLSLAKISYVDDNAGTGDTSMRFYTWNGAASTERMRIDTVAGNIVISSSLSVAGATTFTGETTFGAGGVAADGAGLKHARVTTGSVAGATTALVTITWPTAFADANYTVTADVIEATTSSLSMSVVHIESKTAAAVTVRVINNAVGALTGEIQAIAIHD